jgi:hypothetical protein
MRSLIIMILALFMMAGIVLAEPVVLKCVTSDGKDASDLAIDLGQKELRWGGTHMPIKYDIIHVNDKYISAYERAGDKVGGEIWVIDRRSGEYKRGFVGMLFGSGETAEQARLTATTFSGRCVKRQF